jgi:hypothetical protein
MHESGELEDMHEDRGTQSRAEWEVRDELLELSGEEHAVLRNVDMTIGRICVGNLVTQNQQSRPMIWQANIFPLWNLLSCCGGLVQFRSFLLIVRLHRLSSMSPFSHLSPEIVERHQRHLAPANFSVSLFGTHHVCLPKASQDVILMHPWSAWCLICLIRRLGFSGGTRSRCR